MEYNPAAESYDYKVWSQINDSDDNRLPRYRMYGNYGDAEETDPQSIFEIMLVLIFATIARYLNLKISFIPYQIFLLMVCIFLATIFHYTQLLNRYQSLITVTAAQFENILMPLLIMQISLTTDYRCVMRSLYQIMLISGPRFIVELCILGILMSNIVGAEVIYTNAIIFGLIVSPIYPSSILALVKDLSTMKHLGAIIEMETLITISLSKTLYILFSSINDEILIHWYHYIFFLIRDCIGGIIFGCISGKIAASIMCLFHNKPTWAIIFHLSLAYTVYFYLLMLGVSGYIGVIVVAMFLANERPKLTQDVEKSILYFWECAYHVVYTITFVSVHVLAILIVFQYHSSKYYASIIILYICSNILRFATFLAIYPILKRLGYGMNMPGLLVLSFTNTKDIPNVMFAVIPYYHMNMKLVATIYISHILFYEILSLLINCTFMSSVMHLLGLSDVSAQRRTNMNNCLKFIWKKRALYLPLLKYNRFYAAANWDAINQSTIIRHPYMLKLSMDDEEDDVMINVEATCPDCSRTFFMEKNTVERLNILKEVYSRIIKAKRVLYIRLYENGLLSKESKWLLLYMLEATKDSNFMELKTTDFEKFIYVPHLLKCSRLLKYWRKDPDQQIVIPEQPNREICYYIVMHVFFVPFIHLLIVLQTGITLLNESMQFVGQKFVIYYTIRFIILAIFWAEFIVKVFAFSHDTIFNGLRTYFGSYWRKIDFLLLLLLTAEFSIGYISYYPLEEQPVYYGITVVQVKSIADYIDWVYIVRSLKLTRYVLMYLAKSVERKIDKKYADGYDLGKAMVTGDTELLEMLPTLVDDERIRQEISKNLELRRERVNNLLGETAKRRPSIAVSVKTKQAIHAIINVMKQSIQELRQAGYIDSIEYNKLTTSVEKLANKLQGMEIVRPSSPGVLFHEVPWMGHNNDIIEFLYRNVVIRTYDTGATIIEKGRLADGIYVVVTGLLKLKYVPYTDLELMAQDMGAILIIDYLANLVFNEEIDDYIVSGNSIGELSILTNRPYSCTITADAPVQIYHIAMPVLKAAIIEFNDPIDGLLSKLWKASCFQLASMLLLTSPLFQYHTAEQVQEYIERAFIPDVLDIEVLVLNDLVQDVLLLDGLAVDCATQEVFLPPYYIPRASQKLLLNKEYSNLGSKIETRVMIIPMKDIEPVEIMIRLNQLAEVATKELLMSIKAQMKRKTIVIKHMSRYSSSNKEIRKDTPENINRFVSGSRIGVNNGKRIHKGMSPTGMSLNMDGILRNQSGPPGVKKRSKSSKIY